MYNGVRRKSTMKLRRVLGSFAWVALAAALILVNAAAANAQDKAAEDGQTVQTITVNKRDMSPGTESQRAALFLCQATFFFAPTMGISAMRKFVAAG